MYLTPREIWKSNGSLKKIYKIIAAYTVLCCVLVVQSCLTLCHPMNWGPPGSSVYEILPDKNTGVDCHAILQVIFLTQGLKPCLLHCRQLLYCQRLGNNISLQIQNSHWNPIQLGVCPTDMEILSSKMLNYRHTWLRISVCHNCPCSSPPFPFHFSWLASHLISSAPFPPSFAVSSLLSFLSVLKWPRAHCMFLFSYFSCGISFLPRVLSITSVPAILRFTSPIQIFPLKSRLVYIITNITAE